MLFACPAMADGFYVGADVGFSNVDDVADAEKVSPCEPLCFDEEISINGIHFDADESAWGLTFGWQWRDWFAIEASYADLGEPAEIVNLSTGTAGSPLIVPAISPGSLPSFGDIAAVSTTQLGLASSNFGSYAALSIKETALSARFSKRLTDRYSAYWILGITRANFETRGSLRVPVLLGIGQGPVAFSDSKFAAPDATTGTVWGIGFAWDASDRFSVDIGYRQRDTRVIDVETVSLRAIVAVFR